MYRFLAYNENCLYMVTEKDFGDAMGKTTDAKARKFARQELENLRSVGVTKVEVYTVGLDWTPGSGGLSNSDANEFPVMYRGKPFIAK